MRLRKTVGEPSGDEGLRALLRVLSSGHALLRWARRPSEAVARLPEWVDFDACPACGSEELGTVESIPGIALGRIEEGRFAWSGDTEVDWNGSETARSERGVTLECPVCGKRWVHPSVVLD